MGFVEIRARYRRGLCRFSENSANGQTTAIDFYYSGNPVETGRFGGITFRKDPAGHPWINTACEETGASVGGQTKTSGATKWRAWRSASQFPTA